MKNSLFFGSAVGVLVAAVGLLIAGTTDDHRDDSAYIDYGKGFAPYMAKIRSVRGDDPWEATATAVSDRWLLTAAHVVNDSERAEATLNGKTFSIDRIVRHPDYKLGIVGVNDLALLQTSRPMNLGFYPALSTGEEKQGDICSIAGFGCHGQLSAGHTKYDGRLRAGTNHIAEFHEQNANIHCTASPGQSPLEICIAPGDSGGPLFCRGKLAGVHSLTYAERPKPAAGQKADPPKSQAGEVSVHTRVSIHRPWIEKVISGE